MNDRVLAHPGAEQLIAFGLGKLDEADSLAIQEHLDACDGCQAAVEALPDDTLAALVRAAAAAPDHTMALSAAADTPVATSLTTAEAPLGTPAEPAVPAVLADHPRYRVVALLGAGAAWGRCTRWSIGSWNGWSR